MAIRDTKMRKFLQLNKCARAVKLAILQRQGKKVKTMEKADA